MADYWSPSTTLSNEDSNRKSFQRTVSAQVCSGKIFHLAEKTLGEIFPSAFIVSPEKLKRDTMV